MKRERWITVKFVHPATGLATQIISKMGYCPACGQKRCSKSNPTCQAVQKAIKAGDFEITT